MNNGYDFSFLNGLAESASFENFVSSRSVAVFTFKRDTKNWLKEILDLKTKISEQHPNLKSSIICKPNQLAILRLSA